MTNEPTKEIDNEIETIHNFWFGQLNERGLCIEDKNALWFKSNAETDEICRSQFEPLVKKATQGKLQHWAAGDRSLLALIVLLDQFSRNIYRGTPNAFASDPRALALAQEAVTSGRHLGLPPIHRVFLYLPLEHAEDLEIQNQCVELFEALRDEEQTEQFEGFTRFAVAHRDVVAQFGRFPHRNVILGRQSSSEELAYLEKHGGF